METTTTRHRFKSVEAANEWKSNQSIPAVRNAISIGEPFHEGHILYAPVALEVVSEKPKEYGSA
jgi:hypothetical protein